MKILIINSYDIYGGAARAAYRLHCALLNSGVKSNMIVQRKFSNDKTIIECDDEWEGKAPLYDKMPLLQYPNKTQTLFSVSTITNNKLITYINKSDADIVHLHWITNGFLKIEDLVKIEKPIVWSLHDMWAFTGGCHYDEGCNKYKTQCKYCPELKSSIKNDLSYAVFQRKISIFNKLSALTIVGLSSWIETCAKDSKILNGNIIVNIPNTIDTNTFKKIDKKKSRESFLLPQKKKLILFGAMSANSDPRKGYTVLDEALKIFIEKLPKEEKNNYEFIVFGNNITIIEAASNIKINGLGFIDKDEELITLYSAADVMVVPSKQEVFGQTASEAMSCGVPVVAFATTGLLDIIDHKTNGYLAKPFSSKDLAKGINWVLNNSKYSELCTNARKKIIKTFSQDVVVKQYIKLYKKIIKKYNKQELLIYNSDNSIKFITKELDKWLKELNKKNLKYVVYGKGTYGEIISDYLQDKIVTYVDIKSDLISRHITKGAVYHPANLKNIKFDKIIISVLGREKNIREYLTNDLYVDKNRIIEYTP